VFGNHVSVILSETSFLELQYAEMIAKLMKVFMDMAFDEVESIYIEFWKTRTSAELEELKISSVQDRLLIQDQGAYKVRNFVLIFCQKIINHFFPTLFALLNPTIPPVLRTSAQHFDTTVAKTANSFPPGYAVKVCKGLYISKCGYRKQVRKVLRGLSRKSVL
jgi:hypothetical protein